MTENSKEFRVTFHPICLCKERLYYIESYPNEIFGTENEEIICSIKAIVKKTLDYLRSEEMTRKRIHKICPPGSYVEKNDYSCEFVPVEDFIQSYIKWMEINSEDFYGKVSTDHGLFEQNEGLREQIDTWLKEKYQFEVGTWVDDESVIGYVPVVISTMDIIFNNELYYKYVKV